MTLVSIDLGQLIDLAVGVNSTSNIGIVNFNLLHLLLHTIVNKTNLAKHCVEIYGNNNNNNSNVRKRLKKISKLLPVVEEECDDNIENEFIPSSTAADHNNNNVSTDLSLLDYNNNNNNTSFVVVNNSSVDTIDDDDDNDVRNSNDRYDDDDDTINYNENNMELINNPNKFSPISMISLNDFNELSRRVSNIQDVVNTVVLPTNNDLFENNPDAISTMWNLLNMTKRIDAAELGIEKLSSLLHDLIEKNKEYSEIIETLEKSKCKCNMELLNNMSMENLTNIIKSIIDSMVNSQSCKKKDESLSLTGRSLVDNETENIRKKTLQDRKIDIFDSKINNLESQLADMDVENRKCNYLLAELVEKLQNQKDEIYNLAIICEQIPTIKLDIKKLYEKFNFTIQEIDVIDAKINDLTNELKQLNEIKINREEFYDAISEKADYYMVKQKVSTDEFDALKESLLTQLKIAFAQLNKSESDFKMALNNLETVVNGKIDGNYLTEFENNMMDKLKSLQNRLQALLNLSADSAAGTKMLRNLNCISCDANVSMKRKNDILVSRFDEMHTVIRPLKFNKIGFATGAATTDDTMAERLSVTHSRMKKNNNYNIYLTNNELLCTRYCGGSHTKISAQQKMMTDRNSLRNKITNKINSLNYSSTYNKYNNDDHSYGCNCQQKQ